MFAAVAVAACLLPAPRVVVTPEVAAKLKEIAFRAARDGDAKTVAACLRAGRPVNEPNARGDTLLVLAAYHGHADTVAVLLARPGVRVDARNGMGLTALAGVAFRGHTAVAEQLLKAGAKVDAANERGQTPLMFAALGGRTAMVKRLLAAGADKTRADRDGKTPLSLATEQGADEVVKLLTK